MMEQKEYYAFISYKREDEQWARWLQHKLEHYKMPSSLNGRGDLPQEIRPVFRDSSELNPGNLPQQINNALAASRHLIVICSTHSAQSEWVNLEIESFIAMGKRDRIIPFIIEGSPFAQDPSEECFPPAIRNLPKEQELLGANINEMGREAAAIKTVAQMFGLRFDSLWQRYEREQRRKRALILAAVTFFVLAVMGVAAYIWRQNTLITKSRAELQTAYNNLTVANQKTEQERDRANQERDRAEQEKERAELAEDSIRLQYAIIKQERDKTQQALWRMMENRARFVAEKGQELIDDHDSYKARLLALSILPESLDNPEKPYVVEAEGLLRDAMKYDDAVLRGHPLYVTSIAFSPDGKYVASGSLAILIWEVVTGRRIGEPMVGHTGSVVSVAFSPDGKRVVSGSVDKTVRIWDVATGKQIGETLKENKGSIRSVYFSPDGKRITSVLDDNTVHVWDVASCRQIGESIDSLGVNSSSEVFSPDGKHIAAVSGNVIRIRDVVADRQDGRPLKGNTDRVMSVSFSTNGNNILSLSKDNTMRLWDVVSGQQVSELSIRHLNCTDWVGPVAFSSDGKHIVSEMSDGTLRIWNAATGKQIGDSLKVEYRKVVDGTDTLRFLQCLCVSFSPDGERIAWGGNQGKVYIWDAFTGGEIGNRRSAIMWGFVNSVAFSPDGKRIVSGISKNLQFWAAATGNPIGDPLEGHSDDVTAVAYSPDGKYIVSGSKDSTIRIWDVASGKQIGRPFVEHISPVNYVSYSPDGKHILSKSEDGTVRIWDFPSLQDLINETRKRFKDCELTPEERKSFYLE